MLDKDKVFIIIYVDVRNVNRMDVSEYLRPIANATVFDESVIRLIIPTRDSETRVECINPVLLIDEQYKEVEEKVKNLKKEVETALKTLNNDKR